jgi:IS5 family transposase
MQEHCYELAGKRRLPMLRDRYDPVDIFAKVPQLSRAMDPVLAQIDTLLDDDAIVQQIKADLSKRYRHTTRTGRPSTPVEVILRMLVIKHLYGWSYEQTEQWVADSLVLRDFCRIYWQPVPDDTTLIRWANLIQPASLHCLLDHVVELAQQRKVTRGRKLRIDGTVVETNIHQPTDSSLLNDGVRVISRILKKARSLLSAGGPVADNLFRDRSRSAKRLNKVIIDSVRSRSEPAAQLRKATYVRLVAIGQAMRGQAKAVGELLGQATQEQASKLAGQLQQFMPRLQAVIKQTTRRVLQGEQVPASEKLVSIFEPETAIICKGKLAKPTEYGRMIWLGEVDGGIISRYEVLDGNPADSEQVQPSLAHHQQQFGRAPRLLAADRGCWSAENQAAAEAAGVAQICLPKPGSKNAARGAHEAEGWFVRGCHWRAGIEGRIHGLKVRHKLERCLYHGAAGMERWVGWGVICHDLRQIALASAAQA